MNISEFAKYAGVSKSAVSRFFNNGYLSDEKRDLITKAIEETGYVPSIAARNVKTRVTKLIGVIIPKLSSDSCARVIDGISRVLDERGYEMLLMNSANDAKKEVDYLDLLRNNRVDGVILLGSVFTSLHKTVMKKMHIPVVVVGQRFDGYSCICHDDKGAAYTVTKCMIDRGAKRFGFIGAMENDDAVGRNRRNGFVKALKEAGLTVSREYCTISEFSSDGGYEAAERIFRIKNKPDALFCATDTIASGVMLYCSENGIKIPDDVMLAAVGDSKVGKVMSLTSAHLHYITAGIEAAEMMLSAIARPDSVPRTLQLGYDLIERESTNKQTM